jgi:hypothetical protein
VTAISQIALAQAAVAVDRMTVQERVQLADEIYLQQPTLLASILVLHRMGVSMPQLDVPVNILLVAYQAMKMSGHRWPIVSEHTQEMCLQRLTRKIRFTEGLSAEMHRQAVDQQITQHPEPYLLAFVYGRLGEHDLLGVRTEAEKHLLLAALNLVECIAETADIVEPRSPRP